MEVKILVILTINEASIQLKLDLDIDNLIEAIGQSLKIWIKSLNKPNCGKLGIEDKDECYFLTFNYTKLLKMFIIYHVHRYVIFMVV